MLFLFDPKKKKIALHVRRNRRNGDGSNFVYKIEKAQLASKMMCCFVGLTENMKLKMNIKEMKRPKF